MLAHIHLISVWNLETREERIALGVKEGKNTNKGMWIIKEDIKLIVFNYFYNGCFLLL